MSGQSADDPFYNTALLYDSVVLPQYGRAFSELLLAGVRLPERANVLDLSCRTGYPGLQMLDALGDGRLIAVDADPSFLEIARVRAGNELGRRYYLKQEAVESLSFGHAVFTNVVGNLIDRATTDRGALLSEVARVLRPGGQVVLTMPMRGSFGEVMDIFREVALKNDLAALAERIEQYAFSLPTREMWLTEIESRGFSHVEIVQRPFELQFSSGAHLLSDPSIYVAAMPEWQWCAAAVEDPQSVLYSVQETIDVYFRGRPFDVTVQAGCASAWRERE